MLALERRPVNDRHGFLRPCWIPLLLLFFAFHLASSQSGTGGSVAGQVSDSGGPSFSRARHPAQHRHRQPETDALRHATIYSGLTTTGSAAAQRSYYFRPLDTGAPSFPYVFSTGSELVVAPNAIYFDRLFQNPQIDQTELSLQQELSRRTALTITYLGSYAHELPNFIDTNVDLNALGVLNYTIEDPQHLGPIKEAHTPPSSSTSALIPATTLSPTSPARLTPAIRRRWSASPVAWAEHLVSMSVTHTRTPSTTIRTNPPSQTQRRL